MGQHWPISVKGVLIEAGAVILLENDRNDWELPGGRLELGETPEDCVMREFHEELGAIVQVGPILDSWVFEVLTGRFVFIVTYAVFRSGTEQLAYSHEHRQMRWWPLDELREAALPIGYRRSIDRWASLKTDRR